MPTVDLDHGPSTTPRPARTPAVPWSSSTATRWAGPCGGRSPRVSRSGACGVSPPPGPSAPTPTPCGPGADRTLPGVAATVGAFLDALGLDDVVLVGNDTGGLVAQLVAVDHGERLGALVLTSCDAFEHFPPPILRPFVLGLAHPATWRARRPSAGSEGRPAAGLRRPRPRRRGAARGRVGPAGAGRSARGRGPAGADVLAAPADLAGRRGAPRRVHSAGARRVVGRRPLLPGRRRPPAGRGDARGAADTSSRARGPSP